MICNGVSGHYKNPSREFIFCENALLPTMVDFLCFGSENRISQLEAKEGSKNQGMRTFPPAFNSTWAGS